MLELLNDTDNNTKRHNERSAQKDQWCHYVHRNPFVIYSCMHFIYSKHHKSSIFMLNLTSFTSNIFRSIYSIHAFTNMYTCVLFTLLHLHLFIDRIYLFARRHMFAGPPWFLAKIRMFIIPNRSRFAICSNHAVERSKRFSPCVWRFRPGYRMTDTWPW